MTTTTKFSFHDKRVTLQLARLSTAADQNPDFAAALSKLPDLGFDVYKLTQAEQEILFAEFDEELEQRIKAEFEADASFVIDLKHSNGVCPLCGHVGCRYIFRITNTKNGETIECGSECIITHGLCVKGAETAEHARKALENTIRRHIRKLKIEAWHTDMSFTEAMFTSLSEGLYSISRAADYDYSIRNSARCKARYDLPKLVKFYERTGWLNTEKKWAEWTRLVSFARKFNPNTRHFMNHPLPFGYMTAEAVELKGAEFDEPPAELFMGEEQIESEIAEEPTEKPEEQTYQPEPLPQSKLSVVPVQADLPFNAMAKELVFG